MSQLAVIVLAAGQGTRMRSALPKVLHPVGGIPMAAHVLAAVRALRPARIIVVTGYESDVVRAALAAPDIRFVEQNPQRGTGHAVQQAAEAAAGCGTVMVLNGDSPLISAALLRKLVDSLGEAPMSMAVCSVPDAGPFGRVRHDNAGAVMRIEEVATAENPGTAVERNAGQYVFDGPWLWKHLDRIQPARKTGELYLTALAASAYAEGRPAVTCEAPADEVMGFDDLAGLAEAERLLRERTLLALMRNGVTITDPAATYIDATVTIEADVTILPNCILRGVTRIATGSVIGPGTQLTNAVIGPRCTVQSSVIEDSRLGADVRCGPFAHVRGGAAIGDGCELGNYAEVKNSVLGQGVKMHHFGYLGDAEVGEFSNIGAGVITCNFDGVAKNRTVIGARVFVGSDTMLIAPVTMEDDSASGAGAIVTRDVPAGVRVIGMPARPMRRASED